MDEGYTTETTLHGLDEDVTYFFAVTAYNTDQLEISFSNEVDALDASLDSGSNLISFVQKNRIRTPDVLESISLLDRDIKSLHMVTAI